MNMKSFINELARMIVLADPSERVLPSLLIAQGCLESDFGRSKLAREAKNIFGVKGKGYRIETKEFRNGRWVVEVAEFQRYSSYQESVDDQIRRFTKVPRYKKLDGLRDYKKAAQEVYAAGYATDPRYPEKLIRLIEQYELYEYDRKEALMKEIDVSKVLSTAKMLEKRGVQYLLGAKAVPPTIPKTLDCSGFVRYCFLAAGADVPDGTYYQWTGSDPVQKLEVGDIGLMLDPWHRNGQINHIGIYTGNGKWIHCSYGHNGIREEKTNIFKFHRRFKGIKYRKDEDKLRFPVSEKELGYGIKAIERLGELGILNNPKVHIDNLKKDPSSWAIWVTQAKIAEKVVSK